ncbi:MAG TPA: 50S ribosomal protein L29 [Flavobacteriales bacterium]|jgi:large subunit ribosomal protein L29|nr:50S ribosomal protein L29 [Flavobacteriales bacterium]
MKQSEIVELTNDEIVERIENESSSIEKLRMVHAVSPLENPIQLREKRRNIARLKTELKKRMTNA